MKLGILIAMRILFTSQYPSAVGGEGCVPIGVFFVFWWYTCYLYTFLLFSLCVTMCSLLYLCSAVSVTSVLVCAIG